MHLPILMKPSSLPGGTSEALHGAASFQWIFCLCEDNRLSSRAALTVPTMHALSILSVDTNTQRHHGNPGQTWHHEQKRLRQSKEPKVQMDLGRDLCLTPHIWGLDWISRWDWIPAHDVRDCSQSLILTWLWKGIKLFLKRSMKLEP